MQPNAQYLDLSNGEWPSAEGCAQFVAVYGNGQALVARREANNPTVRRLLRDVEERLNITLKREWVELDAVAEARRLGMAGRRGSADSGMRRDILNLIESAKTLSASDIHIDVEEKITGVSMRIDGILTKIETWTKDYGLRFLGAVYAMADIANKTYSPSRFLNARLAPREGRDDWAFPADLEAVRCQFNPKAFGENYAVLRLLGTIRSDTTLEGLGYEPEQLETLRSFARRNKGLAIVAGPTGSGKSTTVSTLLVRQREQDLAQGHARTCFTIEDPPERRIPGAQQLVVPNTDTDEERGVAYADAIRAALRSDPDVIMIGEIRDLITANLAISASMTGHQVWSTLHCSTAHAIPIRLTDLGVDRSVIFGADELQVAVAQILAPLLCKTCRTPIDLAEQSDERRALRAVLGPGAHVQGAGCPSCRNTGYKGRSVLAEVVRTDAEYLDVLRDRGIVAARGFSRARGEPSINDIALRKAGRGDISADFIAQIMDVPSREDERPLPDLRVA